MKDKLEKLNNEITIEGLRWIPRWRINNGKKDSYVVPFPTTYPVNIVFHGEEKFKYGQYGIHLGQEDNLTFISNENKSFLAKFIDCRKNSPTFKVKLEFYIEASSEKTLIIPPGVAHTFHNLENIFTFNSYKIFLPPIQNLIKNDTQWSPENDIINLPEDVSIEKIEGYIPMSEEASKLVYDRIGLFQSENLKKYKFSHAETREFKLDNGEKINLRLRENLPNQKKSILPNSKIDGVIFKEIPSIKTGDDSCIVPLTRRSPLYLVEHGPNDYNFDSYGIHLGQEDHLVFLGKSTQKITLKLVDMRHGSNTLFTEDEITFYPSPNVELIIPCGVAHALINMSNILTVNRPILYVDDNGEYLPGHDVIDWPIINKNYVYYKTNRNEADDVFYEHIIKKQKELVKTPPTHKTPKSVIMYDEKSKKHVKVILKEKALS